jgi:hypothetical protein
MEIAGDPMPENSSEDVSKVSENSGDGAKPEDTVENTCEENLVRDSSDLQGGSKEGEVTSDTNDMEQISDDSAGGDKTDTDTE